VAPRAPTYERKAFALSLVLHAAIFGLGWMSTMYEPEQVEFLTYQIELVSPSPALQADVRELAAEELVVERPDPQPEPQPQPQPEATPPPPQPQPQPETRPEPTPRPPEPRPTPTPPAPQAQPRTPPAEEQPRRATTTETPPPDATATGEGINVRLEGVRRDYPAYYDNIIRQIQRCFRWSGTGNWETTVFFAIRRDGTVVDIDFVRRSGNSAFDVEAMGAIDCAGQGRFGPLPEDLPYDRLPIQFSFRPTGMER